MAKISICIPTYNRAEYLANCLNSIIINIREFRWDVQVCISDNCSTDETQIVVRDAQKYTDIKYHKNTENLGIPRNFINVVNMADGEFVWLLGDDDLLMPSAIEKLSKLIAAHDGVDFFYINSFHLTTEYVFSYPRPFDTKNLPTNMEKFSSWNKHGEMNFIDLINPKVSFDFLGGMFLSVFRKDKWCQNLTVLDTNAIMDPRTFSHFDNTFPHVKIFAKAFSDSKACFYAEPLSVCLSGAREWAPKYPFVRSVRLIEALNEYRNNGLSYLNYLKCKNFALGYFLPDLIYMIIHKDKSGYEYVKPLKLILNNCLFPGFYFSFITYFVRKFKLLLNAKLA